MADWTEVGAEWATVLAEQWQWIFKYYLFKSGAFTRMSQLQKGGKLNLGFASRPGLLCTHFSYWESGALPRCPFVEAMPLKWKNTICEKYSPDVEWYCSQHTTQYHACRWHSVTIYKVKERTHVGVAVVMKVILLFVRDVWLWLPQCMDSSLYRGG